MTNLEKGVQNHWGQELIEKQCQKHIKEYSSRSGEKIMKRRTILKTLATGIPALLLPGKVLGNPAVEPTEKVSKKRKKLGGKLGRKNRLGKISYIYFEKYTHHLPEVISGEKPTPKFSYNLTCQYQNGRLVFQKYFPTDKLTYSKQKMVWDYETKIISKIPFDHNLIDHNKLVEFTNSMHILFLKLRPQNNHLFHFCKIPLQLVSYEYYNQDLNTMVIYN